MDHTLDDEWNGRTPRTQIVPIGAPGALDEGLLHNNFEQCRSAVDLRCLAKAD